jgi:tRNA G18 (ribose-2'-O)-methylase SpoU
VLIYVDEIADPRLAPYRNVPDPELLRERGIFIAEGRLVVARLLSQAALRTRSVLVTQSACDALSDLFDRMPELPVYVVTQRTMNQITGFNIHRGCLAVGERPPARSWREVAAGASLLAVLERVSNADNVGGIFRSAAAFGAPAVLLGPACADPLYRKAIRTSMGAALRLPFASMPEWPEDLARLKAAGFRLVALTPRADAVPLSEIGHMANGAAALLVGHEGDGLSAEALAVADVRARIPMAAGTDSLNAATAAAIALYELTRR